MKIERLEIHISYDCFNSCIFCSEADQIERFNGNFVNKEIIIKKAAFFAKKGFNHITLTGGEPTFHPFFHDILKILKSLNFKIYVTSNGGLFSRESFVRENAPYIDEICFSIHGHNARLHNQQTRQTKSFNFLDKALKNIENLGKDIFVFGNIVLTQHNFNSIIQILDFASSFKKIKQVLVSSVAPEGNGLRYFESLVVPLEKIQEKTSEIVDFSKKKALILRFFGLPLCVLGDYQNHSNDLWWSPRVTVENVLKNNRIFLNTTYSYRPFRKRIKSEKCNGCSKKNLCGGLFKKYFEIFGDSELTPFIA